MYRSILKIVARWKDSRLTKWGVQELTEELSEEFRKKTLAAQDPALRLKVESRLAVEDDELLRAVWDHACSLEEEKALWAVEDREELRYLSRELLVSLESALEAADTLMDSL